MFAFLVYKDYCDCILCSSINEVIEICIYFNKLYHKYEILYKIQLNNPYESELYFNSLELNFYKFILENGKLFFSLVKLLYCPFKYDYNQLINLENNNKLTKNIFNNCSIKISNIKNSTVQNINIVKNIFIKLYIFNYFEYHTTQKIKSDFPKLHCIKSVEKIKINEQIEQVEQVKQTVQTKETKTIKKNKSYKKIRAIKKKIQDSEEDNNIFI